MTLRLPPEGYNFDQRTYGSEDDEENKSSAISAGKMKSIYPELRGWPNWACEVAYMGFKEAIQDGGNPYQNEPREELFIAFLYAEQELREAGYFVGDDGISYYWYNPEDIDSIWNKYDSDKEKI
jgi:hypothetical protein